MAKDGTNRGGARIGAGAKKKPLAEKIAEGNPGKRKLTIIDFEDQAADLEGQQIPKPSKLLSATQKDGKPLAGGTQVCIACFSTASGTLRNERCQMDSVRGSNLRLWLSCQAPYDGKCYAISLRSHESKLYEPDEPALDGNLSDRKRKLRDGVQGRNTYG